MNQPTPTQILAILRSLNLKIHKDDGRNHIIRCPNPMHEDHNPSCHVDKITGLWKCFACDSRGDFGGRGNMFTLLRLFHRDDLIKIYFGDNKELDIKAHVKHLLKAKPKTEPKSIKRTKFALPPECNQITSKGLGARYLKYLRLRGLDRPTIRYFKLHYLHTHTIMGKRIIIPVYDDNKLMGYQGRSILSNPDRKYKFVKGMSTKELLFNIDGCKGHEAILVEGVFDAMTLHMWGYNALAIFGLNMNPQKVSKIVKKGVKKIVFCLDSDEPAQLAIKNMYKEVCPYFDEVVNIRLPEGKDVDEIDSSTFKHLYEQAHMVKRKEWMWKRP